MPDVTAPPPEWAAAQQVRARIAAACERAGRSPDQVTLVAAAKTVPVERIAACGVRDVGENRAQDLLAKAGVLRGYDLRWHFIGTLQRNKAAKVVGRAALIHSLDSLVLARTIAHAALELGITQDVLVQVNVSGEATKSGVADDAVPEFVEHVRMPGLVVRGLMCIPAPGPASSARPAFRRLAELANECGLEHCSMGMTADFEVAVEEGATIVRVGTAIFGERPVV